MSHRNFRGSVGCLSLGRFGLFRLGVGVVGVGVKEDSDFILGIEIGIRVGFWIGIWVEAILIVIVKVMAMVWIGIYIGVEVMVIALSRVTVEAKAVGLIIFVWLNAIGISEYTASNDSISD